MEPHIFISETRRKDNSTDFLSCSQDGREVITKSSVREIGEPTNKKGVYVSFAFSCPFSSNLHLVQVI